MSMKPIQDRGRESNSPTKNYAYSEPEMGKKRSVQFNFSLSLIIICGRLQGVQAI